MDKFEELIWPAFVKFCRENEFVYNTDNLTKNVVKVTDGNLQLRKPVKGGPDTWVDLDKEFVHMVYHAVLSHKNRITLSELNILFGDLRDLEFVFQVFSKLGNLFKYDLGEKRIYLK